MKKILSILLAAVLSLSITACKPKGQGSDTDSPTETPTQVSSQPTQAPTDTPTQAPTDIPTEALTEAPTQSIDVMTTGDANAATAKPLPKHEYSYDDATRKFEDEFLSFTLPEGFGFAGDLTEQMQAVYPYEIYLSFVIGDTEDITSNVGYMIYEAGGSEPTYASMTEEDIHALMEQTYTMLNGTIEGIEYKTFSGEDYTGMSYEFSIDMMGVVCHQITWSIVKDNTCVAVIYSYSPDETEVCHASVDTIEVK